MRQTIHPIPHARIQISASVIAPVLSQLIVIHDDDDWQVAGRRPWFLVQILRNALHCHRKIKKLLTLLVLARQTPDS